MLFAARQGYTSQCGCVLEVLEGFVWCVCTEGVMPDGPTVDPDLERGLAQDRVRRTRCGRCEAPHLYRPAIHPPLPSPFVRSPTGIAPDGAGQSHFSHIGCPVSGQERTGTHMSCSHRAKLYFYARTHTHTRTHAQECWHTNAGQGLREGSQSPPPRLSSGDFLPILRGVSTYASQERGHT